MSDEGRPAATVGEQTDEWIRARLGRATASRVKDIIKTTKSGWSEYRRHYMIELLAERLTGMRQEPFLSAAMLWGIEAEHQARALYRRQTGSLVTETGFIDHPVIPRSGASPDGLVDDDGLLELKCPNSATHLEILISKTVPEQYVPQVQWQLACCPERKWNDFCSFDSRMQDERLRLIRIRMHRVPEIIEKLEKLVVEFLSELSRMERMLRGDIGPSSEDVAASLNEKTPLFPPRK